jgi:hypothetical protein
VVIFSFCNLSKFLRGREGGGEEGLLRQEQFNSLTGRLNTKSAIYQYIFRREEKGAGKRERGSVWVWGRNSLTN